MLLIPEAYPQSPFGSDHYFQFVPTFQNLAKFQNRFHVRILITTGGTVGLVVGIIEDKRLLVNCLLIDLSIINLSLDSC